MSPVEYVSEPFTYEGGGIAAGVQVYVYMPGTLVKAPIWHDSGLSRAVNPVKTDNAGQVAFFAEPGEYDLWANGLRFPITVDGDPPAVGDGILLPYTVASGNGPADGKNRLYNDTGEVRTIESVRLSAAVVAGQPLIIDVLRGGVTIFTDQAKRPQLAVNPAGGTIKTEDIDITEIADGEYLTISVDQAGTYQNLVVQIQLR